MRLSAFALCCWLGILLAVLAPGIPAQAQPPESCTATLLNRSVPVAEDGSFFLGGVPTEDGTHRVRLHCPPDSGPFAQGQSALFTLVPEGLVELTGIDFANFFPVPLGLDLAVSPASLSRVGGRATIAVTGIFSGAANRMWPSVGFSDFVEHEGAAEC